MLRSTKLSHSILWALSLGLIIPGANLALAQTYPSKPVRIVTNAVGGTPDFTSRHLAQGLSPVLGQPVIIDNRPTGIIPGQVVTQAPPDGYTLLVQPGSFVITPLLQKTPYDPVKDFTPVSLISRAPNILAVHPSLPVKSVKDLIALAKAHPGQLNYSTTSPGGASHLAAELFKLMAGVDIVRVPYKSSSQETADLLGGYVQMTFGSSGQVLPQVKSGKLRGVAITGAQPSPLVPGLPTIAESGLPGYEAGQFTGLFVLAKTPAPIVNRLNQETVRVLHSAEIKEIFAAVGLEAAGTTPEEFAAILSAEWARMSKVIKAAHIRAD